jgi:hypothetical protein
MTLNIELSPDLEAMLRKRAAAAGKAPEKFAIDALDEKLRGPETLAEILAPVHKEFKESGMSKEELQAFSEQALADSRSCKGSGT